MKAPGGFQKEARSVRVVGNEIREVKGSGRVHNVKGLYAIVQVGINSGNHQRL